MHGKLLLLALVIMAASPLRLNAQFGFGDAIAQELKEKAESGDAEAQFQFGLRSISGKEDDKRSAAQGAAWIQKAAKQDHVKAMTVLAELYEKGIGVGQDFKQAANWYRKAAEKGVPEAQTSLALLYAQGAGVEKDGAKAVEWVRKAADQNHAPAQALYGSMLVRGDGSPKNASKAAVWFLRAANQDNPFAQRQLAYLYYTGEGVPVDYARCEAWYRRAVGFGRDPMAFNDLAWFLSTCPDSKFHNGKEAAELARTAVKMIEDNTGEQRHEVIDTMAAALARCGQFTEALVWQKRCLSLLKDDKVTEAPERKKLEDEFNLRLKLYTDKKAYSEKPATPEKIGEPLPNDRVLDEPKPEVPVQRQQKPTEKKSPDSVS